MEKLQIEKMIDENNGTSGVFFRRGNGAEFGIRFQGNLDLYFSLVNFGDNPSFLIGKDNYDVYEIFDTLYREIMAGGYHNDEEEIKQIMFEHEFYGDDYHSKLKELEERNKQFKLIALRLAHDTKLIDGKDVVWHCDDFSIDVGPYFKISRLKNAYQITFGLPKISRELSDEEWFYLPRMNRGHVSIRIRNSGSHHGMYNIPFMRAYRSLLDLDLEYSQISFDELMIEEEVKSGKSLEKILTLPYNKK